MIRNELSATAFYIGRKTKMSNKKEKKKTKINKAANVFDKIQMENPTHTGHNYKIITCMYVLRLPRNHQPFEIEGRTSSSSLITSKRRR